MTPITSEISVGKFHKIHDSNESLLLKNSSKTHLQNSIFQNNHLNGYNSDSHIQSEIPFQMQNTSIFSGIFDSSSSNVLILSNIPSNLTQREARLIFSLVIDEIINIEIDDHKVCAYFKSINSCLNAGKLLNGKFIFGNEYSSVVVDYNTKNPSLVFHKNHFNFLSKCNTIGFETSDSKNVSLQQQNLHLNNTSGFNLSTMDLNSNNNTCNSSVLTSKNNPTLNSFQNRQSIKNQRSRFIFTDSYFGSNNVSTEKTANQMSSSNRTSTNKKTDLVDFSDISGKSILLMESHNDAREYDDLVRSSWSENVTSNNSNVLNLNSSSQNSGGPIQILDSSVNSGPKNYIVKNNDDIDHNINNINKSIKIIDRVNNLSSYTSSPNNNKINENNVISNVNNSNENNLFKFNLSNSTTTNNNIFDDKNSMNIFLNNQNLGLNLLGSQHLTGNILNSKALDSCNSSNLNLSASSKISLAQGFQVQNRSQNISNVQNHEKVQKKKEKQTNHLNQKNSNSQEISSPKLQSSFYSLNLKPQTSVIPSSFDNIQSFLQNKILNQSQNSQCSANQQLFNHQSNSSRQSTSSLIKDVPELSLLNRVPPPANPADQNPPCNTLYVGNLPPDATEAELRSLFSFQKGFRRLSFRTKNKSINNGTLVNSNSYNHGPMCFVEFETIAHATRALAELYGSTLSRTNGSNPKGGIRLSFSKNPLGVRGPGNQRKGTLTQISLNNNNSQSVLNISSANNNLNNFIYQNFYLK